MATSSHFKTRIYSLLFALYLLSSMPKPVRGEDSIRYKYEDYQEDNDRIRVRAHYISADKDLSPNTRLGVVGLIDTITGTTPTGELPEAGADRVPMGDLVDERRSIILNLDHQLKDHAFTFEWNYSNESDYLSEGGALTYRRYLNKKNTTIELGYSLLQDELSAPTLPEKESKDSEDVLIGITQILDPATVWSADLTYGREDGYLADPYKVVEKDIELISDFFLPITFPENRPRSRQKWIFFTDILRDFEKLKGSLQTSYRYFSDDADLDAHTFSLQWFQKISDQIILEPLFRYYKQSAANYYHHDLNLTDILPDRNTIGHAPYFSSDHRLSKMETYTWGAKLVYFFSQDLEFNLKIQRYEMTGLDPLTHPSVYSDADILTVGGRWFF